MKVIDSHVHLTNRDPKLLLELADRYHYDKICVLSIPCYENSLDDLECLTVKQLAPERAYVYGGMVYPKTLEPTRATHEKQLRMMMDAGFDGWKLLESKPSVYRNLRIPLDSDIFDGAFGLAEEAGIPITWHAGDPATFWSAETAPAFAVENNWLCVGEGYPLLSEIYTQVENVLKRHPKLRVSLAHLFFTSDDRAHAVRLLETYPELRLDITPGVEMYQAFLADREGWTEFFGKYRTRLIYGTDMTDTLHDDVFGSQDDINDFILSTMLKNEPFEVHGFSGTGLGLPDDIMRPIFSENYEKRIAHEPYAIRKDALSAYADWLHPYLTEEEKVRETELRKVFGIE